MTILVAGVMSTHAGHACSPPAPSEGQLPQLVKTPWDFVSRPIQPFRAESVLDGILRLMPLDLESSGFLSAKAEELGEWRAILRVVGGLGEGVLWIALQVKEHEYRMVALVVTISYPDPDGNVPDVLIDRRLLAKCASIRQITAAEVSAQALKNLVEALEIPGRCSEPLVLPNSGGIVFDVPVLEVRLEGDMNEATLRFNDRRSAYRRRILTALKGMFPQEELPFKLQ
jgi:hypothetical protein